MQVMRFIRHWLLCVGLALLAGCGATRPAADNAGTLPFTLKPLAPGVYSAVAVLGAGAGANAGFVIGDDAVAVIDTFFAERAAEALLQEIRKRTSLPVRYVINTHHHIDHVAGNAVFHREGAVLIGERDLRDWVHSENLRLFGANITLERRAQVEALVAPDLGYARELQLHLGQRRLVVRAFTGHTGADSVVLVPDAGVLFAGDLVWHKSVPNLIDATVGEWIATLAQLSSSSAPEAIVVPGHGDVGTIAELAEFRGYLLTLRSAVGRQLDAGLEGTALQTAVLTDLAPQYGEWAFFKSLAPRNVHDMAAELQGRKRVPRRAAVIDALTRSR